LAPESDSARTVKTTVPSPQLDAVTFTDEPVAAETANVQFSAVPLLRKSVPAIPITDSLNVTLNVNEEAFVMRSLELSPVSDAVASDAAVTLGTVRSTVTDGDPEADVATFPAMSATWKPTAAAMPLEPLVPKATEENPLN